MERLLARGRLANRCQLQRDLSHQYQSVPGFTPSQICRIMKKRIDYNARVDKNVHFLASAFRVEPYTFLSGLDTRLRRNCVGDDAGAFACRAYRNHYDLVT
jgi:hypothetical protein